MQRSGLRRSAVTALALCGVLPWQRSLGLTMDLPHGDMGGL